MNVCSSLVSVVNRILRVTHCVVVFFGSGIQFGRILAVSSGSREFFMRSTSKAFRFSNVLELNMVGTVNSLRSITVVIS